MEVNLSADYIYGEYSGDFQLESLLGTVASTTAEDETPWHLPAICSDDAVTACFNISLATCELCNLSGGILLVAVMTLLGVVAVLDNTLILWCRIVRRSEELFYDTIRASLSVADLITRLQLLIVIPFNFAWTINTTPIALYKDVAYLRRSPSTVVGGIFFLLGFTASLYHLLFLILLNFYALCWKTSLVHPKQRKAAFGLAVVWIAGLLSAVVPTCFSHTLTFAYSHTTFLYTLDLMKVSDYDHGSSYIIFIAVVFLIPFVSMGAGETEIHFTVFFAKVFLAFVATLRVKYSGEKTTTSDCQRTPGSTDNETLQELVTIVKMQIGFTLTCVPSLIATVLTVTNGVTPKQYPSMHMICLYLSLCRSLVNFFVYIVRYENFRAEVKKVLTCLPFSRTESDCNAPVPVHIE